eukprot:TRINITY_DN9826_c0_g1_i5.p1 TRINITY_DN9826_c0_g1~~TRINITY_DN9826_c0_g1_i5.p1  ORF type:complete len:258 (-),score=51.45 TRINITY_DN9826_c0_g1_i5:2-775(-)
MISKEQLERHYELAGGRTIIKKPALHVVQTVRKGQPLDERAKYQEVVIKTVKGIPLSLDNPNTMLLDLSGLINGILTYYRSQSDLTVNIEGVCLVPSDDFQEDGKLFVDQIIVMEHFGKDLMQLRKPNVKWSEPNIDKLVRFLIRTLRMMKQRGILHGDIKPQNIVSNEGYQDFKMIDFDDSGFHRSSLTVTKRGYTEAYASNFILNNARFRQVTAEEWRRNDLHCAAITLLQVIYGLSVEKVLEYRGDEDLSLIHI